MRIRTIKPEFFKHDKLSELKPLTRLLFISLWCLADRRGRMEDRPKRIKVECLPYDDCDVDAMLWELHSAGFIDRYEAEGMQLIEIESFEKHQRISGKEADSESDLPGKQEGSIREAPGGFSVAQERKGKERKGKESPEVLEEIYREYPKKVAKEDALKAIARALKKISPEALKSSVKRYALTCQGADPKFIPYPATWFNRGQWADGADDSGAQEPTIFDPSDLDGISPESIDDL